ncbi:MAG: diaminopimelate epimerase [Acidimicrobiia bacterium]|nr:diaminopimelate epimerase [Acidimicrobiia bacterium]
MDFVKMEGLGNDFVVVDGPLRPSAADIEAWCDRRRGIGADGVLAVTSLESGVRMDYWNADGSPAEMCGNGLRCVARYARDRGLVDTDAFTVQSATGPRQVELLADGRVRAHLATVADDAPEPFEMAGYRLESVSVGNPHAIAFVDDTYSVPVSTVGPIVEGDPHFPDRTNVEFATVVDRSRIDLRVWERGSGETLACGTGAAATAALAHRKGLTDGRVTVMLPGGPLDVEIVGDEVWIEGPARTVFSGTL